MGEAENVYFSFYSTEYHVLSDLPARVERSVRPGNQCSFGFVIRRLQCTGILNPSYHRVGIANPDQHFLPYFLFIFFFLKKCSSK